MNKMYSFRLDEKLKKLVRDYCLKFELSTGQRLTSTDFISMAIREKLEKAGGK